MRACAPLHFVPPCRPVFARRRAAFARSRSAAATTLALDTCPARTLLTMEIDTPVARATCARLRSFSKIATAGEPKAVSSRRLEGRLKIALGRARYFRSEE